MKPSISGLAAFAALACSAPVFAESPAGASGPGLYEKGRAAYYRGNLPEARRCFEQLLAAKPDFDLARIHLAQVAAAERELAKIPASLKLARARSIERLALDGGTVEEAVAAAAREIERAGRGPGSCRVVTSVPSEARGRSISLNVRNAPIDHVLQAIGFAGGVTISYSDEGLLLREPAAIAGKWDAGDPKAPGMDAAAKEIILERFVMEAAEAADALDYLRRKAAELSGGKVRPFFVIRHDCVPRGAVTLDLRNVSLHDALRSVCLVLDLEEKWFPWGAGIANRQAAAVVNRSDPGRVAK